MKRKSSLDYLYIRAWGRSLGSFQNYIDNELEKARADNAPQNAIYRDNEGRWHTFDNISSEVTKSAIKERVEEMQG